jgi:hypothetical protein
VKEEVLKCTATVWQRTASISQRKIRKRRKDLGQKKEPNPIVVQNSVCPLSAKGGGFAFGLRTPGSKARVSSDFPLPVLPTAPLICCVYDPKKVFPVLA